VTWVLAIDFGTTSTSVAIRVGERPELVEIDGYPRMPSMVFWREGTGGQTGRLMIGLEAENLASRAPWALERTPKRRLGDEFMLLGDQEVRVTDAVAAILRTAAAEAIRRRGGESPSEVRLTYPARWGAERLAKLGKAAQAAGLAAPRFIAEPVAAATYFASERLEPGEHVAVYDLGGGTFDTAVLRRSDADSFEVVGVPGGREDLGGEDFDDRLYRHLGAQLDPEQWTALRASEENAWRQANLQLMREARTAKETLSRSPDYDVYVPTPVDAYIHVTADELQTLITDDIDGTVTELERTIIAAGLKPTKLAAIYLAGGSSRIPLVARLIERRLGQPPDYLDDPKSVIALGAARATQAPSEERGKTVAKRQPPLTPTESAAHARATEPATWPRSLATGLAETALDTTGSPRRPGSAAPGSEDATAETRQPATVLEPGETTLLDRGETTLLERGETTLRLRDQGRRRSWLVAGALLAALLPLGFLLGHSGGGRTGKATAERVIASGFVQLAVPTTWNEPSGTYSVPGLALTQPITRVEARSGGVLQAGVLKDPEGRSLLPATFLSTLHSAPTLDDTVRLGKVAAYRYRRLTVNGLSGAVTAFVAPTTAGVLALACVIPATSPAPFERACEGAASTLRLIDARPVSLGPDPAYGRTLGRVLAALLDAQPAVRALAGAHTRKAQARLAKRSAEAHAEAADALSRASPRADAAHLNMHLVAGLEGAASGYSEMGRAARSGARDDYERARQKTESSLNTVHQALASLSELGYGT
jgi:actin-like ATPase involved in cell morphogenesis